MLKKAPKRSVSANAAGTGLVVRLDGRLVSFHAVEGTRAELALMASADEAAWADRPRPGLFKRLVEAVLTGTPQGREDVASRLVLPVDAMFRAGAGQLSHKGVASLPDALMNLTERDREYLARNMNQVITSYAGLDAPSTEALLLVARRHEEARAQQQRIEREAQERERAQLVAYLNEETDAPPWGREEAERPWR